MSSAEEAPQLLNAELLRLLVEQSGDGIIMSDEHGVLRIFNPEAERQHGVAKQEVAAPAWAETYGLFTLEGRKLALTETPLFRAVQGEKIMNARWIVRQPNGDDRILTGTATPLRHPDGRAAGAVLITRDETERLHHERERTDLLDRERIARSHAEALAQEVTEQMRAVEETLRELRDRTALLEQELAGKQHDR